MTDDPNDLEAQRQEQAEREFTAAREALAAQDQQQRSQWTSEEARQAAIEASKAQQMTVAPEQEQAAERESGAQVTRMYRGIGKNVWEAEEGDALFFSTDPERAATFGELHYVDVTADELAKFEQPHSQRILDAEPAARNDYRTADPDIIARLQPVPQPEHDPDGPGSGKPQEPGAEQRPHVDTVWMEPSAELTDADRRDMAEAFKQVPTESNDNRPEIAAVVSGQEPDAEWEAEQREILSGHDGYFPDEIAERLAEENGILAAEEIGIAKAEQQPEALTREAIERDPMNAVTMPLPDNADCELLGVVADTAAQIAEDKREQAYTALYEGGPEAGKPFEADADRADRRFDEAAERFEAMACDHAAGEGPTHEADLLTPAEAFRSNADTATMTAQQCKEQDIGARIVALEALLGAGDRDAAREYQAGQDGFADRIENAAGPEHIAFLAAGKLAHSQDYAAELCEQAGVKLGLEDRFEEAAGFMAESRAHREIAGIERGAVPEPQQAEPGKIGQDMADAAKEALGGAPHPEFVIVGPSQEQQAGQQPDPAEQIGQAHMPNYAELRAFTEGQQAAAGTDHMEAHAPNYAALKAATEAMQAVQQEAAPTGPEIAAEAPVGAEVAEADGKPYESKKAPSRPGFNMQMTAQVVGTPEGWQLVTALNQKGFGNKQEADAVAHNGQAQNAAIMAGMVIVGAGQDGSDGADTVAAENAVKAQRDENARATEPQEANRGVREASEPKTLAEIMAEKAERNAEAVSEFQAADQERGHEAGFGMSR